MALGFEKMEKGSLGIKYTDRTTPMDKHFKLMVEQRGFAKAPAAPQMFGNAGIEHMERYGTTAEHFAKIGWKNHKHSVNNPYSQFQDEYTLEQILAAPKVLRPAHQAAVLPDLGRRRRGGARERGLRAQARARGQGRRDPRHGDGDRHAEHLRREEHDQAGRLRPDA